MPPLTHKWIRQRLDCQHALSVNGIAPGILAEEAKPLNAILVHYSTDYVFDGEKSTPYTEADSPHPLNFYGESKLAGEKAIQAVGGQYFIFRTSWVYSLRRKNFLQTMLKLAGEQTQLKIVNDQVGTPTWSRLVAEATAQLLIISLNTPHASFWGLYHLTAAGQASRYEFAQEIFKIYGQLHPTFRSPELLPIATTENTLPAKRPAKTVLSNERLQQTFSLRLPSWEKTLRLCLDKLT